MQLVAFSITIGTLAFLDRQKVHVPMYVLLYLLRPRVLEGLLCRRSLPIQTLALVGSTPAVSSCFHVHASALFLYAAPYEYVERRCMVVPQVVSRTSVVDAWYRDTTVHTGIAYTCWGYSGSLRSFC